MAKVASKITLYANNQKLISSIITFKDSYCNPFCNDPIFPGQSNPKTIPWLFRAGSTLHLRFPRHVWQPTMPFRKRERRVSIFHRAEPCSIWWTFGGLPPQIHPQHHWNPQKSCSLCFGKPGQVARTLQSPESGEHFNGSVLKFCFDRNHALSCKNRCIPEKVGDESQPPSRDVFYKTLLVRRSCNVTFA